MQRWHRLLSTRFALYQCPVVPGLKRDDWPLEDPKEKPIEAVRAIRDEIRARVKELVENRTGLDTDRFI
jgi:arsenate reductase (thioredoxin)